MTAKLRYEANDECLFEVIRAKGTYLSKMGFTRASRRMLHPEEALFLAENKLATVEHGEVMLGVPHLYRILFHDADVPSFCYAAFSHMIRAGYILRRRSDSSAEKTLNLTRCSYDIYTKMPISSSPDYVLLVISEITSASVWDLDRLWRVEQSLSSDTKLLIASGDATNVRISRFVTDAKVDSLNLNRSEKAQPIDQPASEAESIDQSSDSSDGSNQLDTATEEISTDNNADASRCVNIFMELL